MKYYTPHALAALAGALLLVTAALGLPISSNCLIPDTIGSHCSSTR